ncbi:hypothetical protein AVEN_5292-1 [Araneus ventricosus]|uniref:Uncharacterized protein n=1 Tax=Araneus ventricosus TaxID=182803 RepID=A0A4Y2CXE3_ARAVE|nr:hypothetical protein AVEN_5292-1 [Araneus ventricosus]
MELWFQTFTVTSRDLCPHGSLAVPPLSVANSRGDRYTVSVDSGTTSDWDSKATRGLFGEGPRKFEPRSDNEDDTRACSSFSKLLHHTSGRTFDQRRQI